MIMMDNDMESGLSVCQDRSTTSSAVRSKSCLPLAIQMDDNTGNKPQNMKTEERFVWPWKGIWANIPTQEMDGRLVGGSNAKLRAQLSSFDPSKVVPLWNYRGHSGFAIVEFASDFVGFKNAVYFESDFELKGQGKRDWEARLNNVDELFGWLAREDNYLRADLIGDYLRRHGNLKTVAEVERDEKVKNNRLVAGLLKDVEMKNRTLMELDKRCAENEAAVERIMLQRDHLLNSYSEEIAKMNRLSSDHLKRVVQDNTKLREMLESKKKEAEQTYLKLSEMEKERSNMEEWRLAKEMKSVELASIEEQTADGEMWKLVEKHKEEIGLHVKKVLQLEQKLHTKQKLELEIDQLKVQLEETEVMKNVVREDHPAWLEKFESLQEELKDKIEEMEELESLNQALIIRESRTNEELEDARDELLKALEGRSSSDKVGVKRMGEIDQNMFKYAYRLKLSGKSKVGEEVVLLLKWQNEVQNSAWHPFKLGSHGKNVINEEDEKLQFLKELGDKAYDAAVTALLEMNEYDPVGRCPVPELWNFYENRKAVGKCNPEVSNPSTNPNGERRDNPKGAVVKCPEMRTNEKKKRGCENPSKLSPKKPKAKDLKKIPRDKVRRNKKVIPKAWMPKGMLTRQETSEAYKPKSKKVSTEKDSRKEKPRLSHFEVGECSGTKDEMGKCIEESEVSEAEELEMLSEHEMLRRMKRKPKTKEKTYRDAVCSGCNPK